MRPGNFRENVEKKVVSKLSIMIFSMSPLASKYYSPYIANPILIHTSNSTFYDDPNTHTYSTAARGKIMLILFAPMCQQLARAAPRK